MQTFQAVQRGFESLGFSRKLAPFNRIVLRIFAIDFLLIISQLIFLIHEADSSQEYMESIYTITACSCIFVSLATTIFITDKLFTFIDGFDELINESKLNFNHSKLEEL